jgi:large subunit ribosomal protein L5e
MLVLKVIMYWSQLAPESCHATVSNTDLQTGLLVHSPCVLPKQCPNNSSAYATGLLVARRALTKLGLADKYQGVSEPDGTITMTEALEDEDAPRPFKCYLDVGLKRTSTGSRVFGAMKGASDGGIFIPHSEKRFPGFDSESKELDAEVLKKYIFGGHVAEYMESLEEEDEER